MYIYIYIYTYIHIYIRALSCFSRLVLSLSAFAVRASHSLHSWGSGLGLCIRY